MNSACCRLDEKNDLKENKCDFHVLTSVCTKQTKGNYNSDQNVDVWCIRLHWLASNPYNSRLKEQWNSPIFSNLHPRETKIGFGV